MKTKPLIKSMKTIAILVLAFCVGLAGSASAKEKLVIGLIPEMNVFQQMERFKPLAAYLSEKLDIDLQLTMLSRYGNIVERFQEQQVDGAFLGSFTGALCISQLGVEPLARPVNKDGTSTYFGYIFARKDSGIKTVADMKGKIMVFVERATTAGYLFPLAYFKSHGVTDIGAYFAEHYFAGSHDAAILAVLGGQADVGACKNTIYDKVRKTRPEIDQELVILASSARVPSNGLCVKASLDESLKKRLKEALLGLHETPKGLDEVLKQLDALRFVETSQKDYQPVIDIARDAGISLNEYRYQNQ